MILALVIGMGGHWVVLQSAAWARMLVDYSRDASLAVAIEKTFDGQHPCSLCKRIDQVEKSQKSGTATQPPLEIKAVLTTSLQVAEFSGERMIFGRFVPRQAVWQTQPPTPPPQFQA